MTRLVIILISYNLHFWLFSLFCQLQLTKYEFTYERNRKTYIEEPYNRIWKIPSDLYKSIKINIVLNYI